MRSLKIAGCAVGLMCTLLWSRPAHAGLTLGVGADYWLERSGTFELTFKADTALARRLTLGGRFGAMFATRSNTVGVPLDLQLRFRFSRGYLEGSVGPWLLFNGDLLRARAAFGFGLFASGLELGMEVGWLDPAAMVGLRLGYRI